MSQFDLGAVLSFSAELKKNNNRPWFIQHRDEYEFARGRFEEYIAALINKLSFTEPLTGLTPKDCIFRLNRDLRFTKDKTPYKPYMSAYIAPGGRKSRELGYYVHLEPGNAMLAGGFYEPNPQQLSTWREAISRDARPFRKIISDATFKQFFGGVDGDKLKTIPRGFPVDHPDADLLRLKSVTVTRKLPDAEILTPGFFDTTLKTFHAMKPFLSYLGQFV